MTLEKSIEQIVLNYNLMCGTGKQQMMIKEMTRAASDYADRRYNDGFNDAMRSVGWSGELK